MRYLAITDISPEEVLARAKEFYAAHSRLEIAEESPEEITFEGEIGMAKIRADREYSHTHVHATTNRVVGLDVTDITKRFLYTLPRA